MKILGRFGRQATIGQRGGFAADDLVMVARLAAAELGPEIVPDPTAIYTPEEAVRVDLPKMIGQLPVDRSQWPEAVHAYYEKNGANVRRGCELERRAATFDDAKPLLTAMLVTDPGGPCVELKGPLPGTAYRLSLTDGKTFRLVLPSTLERWSVTAEQALQSVRDQLSSIPIEVAPLEDHPRVVLLSMLSPVAGLVVDELTGLRPELVGPLGTLVAVLGANIVLACPLSFEPGLRANFSAAYIALAETRDAPDPCRLPTIYYRNIEDDLIPICDPPADGAIKRVDRVDSRFLGVLTAVEPRSLLPVPEWASMMTDSQYTRFAGVVAALLPSPGIAPDAVRIIEAETPTRLRLVAQVCMTTDPESWPRVVLTVATSTVSFVTSGQDVPRTPFEPALSPTALEEKAALFVASLRTELGRMSEVSRAGLYLRRGVHVRASNESGRSAPPKPQTGVRAVLDLCLMFVHSTEGDAERDLHRLMAACAIARPKWAEVTIERTSSEDARFTWPEFLVPLK